MASPFYKFGGQQHYVYNWQHRAPAGSRAAETRALGAMESPLDRSLQIGSGIGQGAQIFTPDLRVELGMNVLGADPYEESFREGAEHYPALTVPTGDWPPAYGYGSPEPVGFFGKLSDNEKKLAMLGAAGAAAWYFFFRKKRRRRRR